MPPPDEHVASWVHTVEIAAPNAAQLVALSTGPTVRSQKAWKAAQPAAVLVATEAHVESALEGEPEYWLADDWQVEMTVAGTVNGGTVKGGNAYGGGGE